MEFYWTKFFKSKKMEEKPSKKKKQNDDYDQILENISVIKEENDKKIQMVEKIEEDDLFFDEENLKKEILEQQKKMKDLIVKNQQKIQNQPHKLSSFSESPSKTSQEIKCTNGLDEKYIKTYTDKENLESSKRFIDVCHNIILKGNVLTGNCLDSVIKIQFSDDNCTKVEVAECNSCKNSLLWCTHICSLLLSMIQNPSTVLRFDKFQEQIVNVPKSVLDLSFINSIKHHSEFYDLILEEIKLLKDPVSDYEKIQQNNGKVESEMKPKVPSIFNFRLIYQDMILIERNSKVDEYIKIANELASNNDYMNSFYVLIHVLLPLLKTGQFKNDYENIQSLLTRLILEIKKVFIRFKFKQEESQEIKEFLEKSNVNEDSKKIIDSIKVYLNAWDDPILKKVLKGDKESYYLLNEESELKKSRIEYLEENKMYEECFYYSESKNEWQKCCEICIKLNAYQKAISLIRNQKIDLDYYIKFLDSIKNKELNKEEQLNLYEFLEYIFKTFFKEFKKEKRISFFTLSSYFFVKLNREEMIYKYHSETKEFFSNYDYLIIYKDLKEQNLSEIGYNILINVFETNLDLNLELCLKLTEIKNQEFFLKLLKRVNSNPNDVKILNQCSPLIPYNVEFSKIIFEYNIKVLQYQDPLKKHLDILMKEKEFEFLNQIILKEFKLKKTDTIYHSPDYTYCEVIFDLIKCIQMIPSCLHIYNQYTQKFIPTFNGYRIGELDLQINCPCTSCQAIKSFQYNQNCFEMELTNPSEALQESIAQCPKLRISLFKRTDHYYPTEIYIVKKVLGGQELIDLNRLKSKTIEMTNWLLDLKDGNVKNNLKKNINPFVISITSKKIPKEISIEDIQSAYSNFTKVFDEMFILYKNEFMEEKKQFFNILEAYYTQDSPNIKAIIKFREMYSKTIYINDFKTVKDYFFKNNFIDSWKSYFKTIFIKSLYETYNNLTTTNHNDVASLMEIFLQEETTEYAVSFFYKIQTAENFEIFSKLLLKYKSKLTSDQEDICIHTYSQFIFYQQNYANQKIDEIIELLMEQYPSYGFQLAHHKTEALKKHVVSNNYNYTHQWLKILLKYYLKLNKTEEWIRYFKGLLTYWSSKKKFTNVLKSDPEFQRYVV